MRQPPLIDAVEVPLELGSAKTRRDPRCQQGHRLTVFENEPDAHGTVPVADDCLYFLPGNAAPAEAANDRAIHTVTEGLSPTEVCRSARLGSVASAGRWLACRAFPRTLSPDRSRSDGQPPSTRFRAEHAFRRLPIPANRLGPFELNFRLRTLARAASTVRLLSGDCPANSNPCR